MRGFTLIEILIALFIFAILGSMAAIGLHAVSHTYQQLEHTQQQIRRLQFVTTLMRRDFTQIIMRSATSTSGNSLAPLVMTTTDNIEFTTGGFANPYSAEKRSTLQRIQYEFENHELIRITWPVLDRAPNATPQYQVLLRHLKKMSLRYVDKKGQLLNVWTTTTPLPQAIVVTLTLENGAIWRGVFPLVSRGAVNEL